MRKILYCGMGHDIVAPLLFVPSFACLYAIDHEKPDKKDIRQILEKGTNSDSWLFNAYRDYDPMITPLVFPKSKILDEEDDGSCWRLGFQFDGHYRQFAYFYSRDFIKKPWPREIRELTDLMSFGAVFPFTLLMNRIYRRCLFGASYYQESNIVCLTGKFDRMEAKNSVARHLRSWQRTGDYGDYEFPLFPLMEEIKERI
jgi:hypothetical protein